MSATQPRAADVLKGGVRAATLTKSREGVAFEYLAEYLTAGGREVATSLPVSRVPLTFTGGAVPPFFAGLLPEGRRLSTLRCALKTSADDEFGLILAVGGDLVGDVTVQPPDAVGAPLPALSLPEDLSSLSVSELIRDIAYDPVGIPGVQEKFSGRLISAPGKQAGEQIIVKLDPPDYPHVVRNEAAFLGLASAAGLDVPGWRLAVDANGEDVLCITRFDRIPSGQKLAVEDASQVLGLWPADKYRVSAEQAALALIEQCAAGQVAAKTLFEQVIFAVLTGNGDQHSKNLSILRSADGAEFRVSPAYDLPSTAVYGDSTFALPIAGSQRGLSRKGALRFAATIGLPERAAERSLNRLLRSTAPTLMDVASLRLPYNEADTRRWQRELDYRRRQLE